MKDISLDFYLPRDGSPSQELRVCVQAAWKAGQLLKGGFGTDYAIAQKTAKNDLVTAYDHASEELITSFLRTRFPSFSFLCEERGHDARPDTDYCWIVDPLDGTVNFAHNIPVFCVSIALAKKEKILCGVIYQPNTEELFIAETGLGAYLNGKRLRVSNADKLDSAFVSTSLSFNLHKDPSVSIAKLGEMANFGFPLRAIGSTALNMAYIAAGRFDAYWSLSGSVSAWDVAAGKLMIEEAGGRVSQCDGSTYHLYKESNILATNSLLHDETIKRLQG